MHTNYERDAEELIKTRDMIDLLDKTRFMIGDVTYGFNNLVKNYDTFVSIA